MPLPTIAFGILLSTLYAGLYHLLRGGSTKQLGVFLLLSWAGFWLGETLGKYIEWTFALVGVLNAGPATIGSVVFMLIGEILSRLTINQRKTS